MLRKTRSQARQDCSSSPEDPVQPYSPDSPPHHSIVPVLLDKFWGEDLDSWLYMSLQWHSLSVGRARAEYRLFVAVTPEADLS